MANVQRSWRQGCRARARRGVILVKVALVLPVLVGMLGIVLDVGLLFAGHRQVQNAADAAALAAAMDLVRGKPDSDARATADTFVRDRNALGTAVPLVAGESFHHPPATGAYAGKANYVEVQVTFPMQTLFIQVLGVDPNRLLKGRAVAGFEPVSAGEGVMVLDRNAKPGLNTSSANATIKVNGRIVVNSEGGGIDEKGALVPGDKTAASAGTGGIYATDISVVGGVNSLATFRPYVTGDPNPVRCRALPEPDPLIMLPTPTVSNGVYNVARGTFTTSGSTNFNGDLGTPKNFKAVGGETLPDGSAALAGQFIPHPGIYTNISISQGANVKFMPGIYVLRPPATAGGTEVLTITGGTVSGKGIMLYSTGHNYTGSTGWPDADDREQLPPAGDGARFQTIKITSPVTFTPIDTKDITLTYTPAVSDAFDGILFYQRRRNTEQITIVGGGDGMLTGTLYTKWAQFNISGQGSYDAQFICGSMDVTGQGNITILGGGKQRGRANQVFLVE